MCIELRRGYQNILCQHFTLVRIIPCPNVQFSSTPDRFCAPLAREIFIAVRMHPQMCADCRALAQVQGPDGLWDFGVTTDGRLFEDLVWFGEQPADGAVARDGGNDGARGSSTLTGASGEGTRPAVGEAEQVADMGDGLTGSAEDAARSRLESEAS